jgi:hypothetical protein
MCRLEGVLHNLKNEQRNSDIVLHDLRIFLPNVQSRKHSKIYIFQGHLDPSEKCKTLLRNGEYQPTDRVTY